MISNAFVGKTAQPSDSELASALGASKKRWDTLLAELAEEQNLTEHEWKSPYPKFGWSLRLKRGQRNILYLSPGNNGFFVAFVLSDKAVRAIRDGKLSKKLLQLLDEAPRYPEGTGLRLEIRGSRDIAVVKKLAAVKLAH